MDDSKALTVERRQARRYPIVLTVKLATSRLEMPYSGVTVNMSHLGILLEVDTEHGLITGEHIVMNISWPAHFENGEMLMLQWQGIIVRITGRLVAVNHVRHEFRIRSRGIK